MKRAALYIRVSTDEQARHGLSLGEQRADLERYANAHHYTVVGIYADEGSTARKALSRRKELQRLLDDVRDDKIDIILFKCLDRWFRNIRDYYKVQDILDAHHVDWECTQEKYNTTTTNGRLMLNIKLSVAQNESDQTSDRIKYVNEGKMKRKEALSGSKIYGYDIRGKHYAVNPAEAKVVRLLYDRVLAGDSIRHSIALVNASLDQDFTARMARSVLRREMYTGRFHGMDDYCERIVSRDEFERMQELIEGHPRFSSKGLIHLFKGKIICPSCGCLLHARERYYKGRNTGTVYSCSKRYQTGPLAGEHRCSYGGGVSEAVVERYLVRNMAGLLEAYFASFQSDKQTRRKDVSSMLKAVEGKMMRLKELYIDGIVDRDEFDRRMILLQKDFADLQEKQHTEKEASKSALQIYKQIDEFEESYALLTRESKRELWQKLIKRIELGETPKSRTKGYTDFRITFN